MSPQSDQFTNPYYKASQSTPYSGLYKVSHNQQKVYIIPPSPPTNMKKVDRIKWETI
jgi:hypothetical protein